jgi:predicted ABC-type ATPase
MADWAVRLVQALVAHARILVVLAGSNGAGKTTFFRRYLESTFLDFVNADDIARALNPIDPGAMAYEAMKIAELLRESLLQRKHSFSMETVLSDTRGSKLDFLQRARDAGYGLVVIYIRRDFAIARQALALAHFGLVLDNSSSRHPYQLIEICQDGKRME